MIYQPVTGKPIWDLQQMLLDTSQEYPQFLAVVPDGIFGENTLEAVMVFQWDFQLPVTGVVNNATWDAISRQYRLTLRRSGPPVPLQVMPHSAFLIQPGERRQQMMVVQAMYDSLVRILTCFQPTAGHGVNQDATLENTRRLQKQSGMPSSGIIDLATWSNLAQLYHLFVTRVQ